MKMEVDDNGMGPRGSEQPQGFTTVRALPQSTTGRPLSHTQTHAHMPMVGNSRNKVLTKTYFLCPSIAFSMNRESCCLERLHLSLRGTWLVVNDGHQNAGIPCPTLQVIFEAHAARP